MSETKSVDQFSEIRMTIQKMEGQFKAALPPHIPVEKFMRVVLTAIQMNPNLLGLDRRSLFASATKAAQDGLLPDGREGAIVPFKNQAQWMPMISGILKKIRNSGELANINSQIVYEGDEFDYWIDESGEHLRHRPSHTDTLQPRKLAYAIARTKDGSVYVEVMTEKQIQDVKNVSRSKDSGPWSGPFESEMVRKTVLRRLAKRLPMSTDVEDVIQRDDEMYDLNQRPAPQITKEEKPMSRLARIVQQADKPAIDTPELAEPEEEMPPGIAE